MQDDFPEIIASPLSGRVTHDGVTVEVRIQRFADRESEWVIEVIGPDGGAYSWSRVFETDKDAYAEFYRTIDRDGVLAVLGTTPGFPQ